MNKGFFFQTSMVGVGSDWINQSASWVAFVSQKFLRDQYQQDVGCKKLTLGELAGVGSTVALFVSVITSATDRANNPKTVPTGGLRAGGAFRGLFPAR